MIETDAKSSDKWDKISYPKYGGLEKCGFAFEGANFANGKVYLTGKQL